MKWHATAQTDRGMVRENNEDAFLVDNRFGLYMVSDGMGGVEGGEVASYIVVHDLPPLIKQSYQKKRDIPSVKLHSLLQEKIHAVNDLIYREGQERGLHGMGATLVSCLIKKDQALITHLGDSRCYLFRNNTLTLMTKDHTDPIERNALLKVMGMAEHVQADMRVLDLKEGDRLLLCSDGLNHLLSDQVIEEACQNTPSTKLVQQLIDQSNQAGGYDNITIVLIQS